MFVYPPIKNGALPIACPGIDFELLSSRFMRNVLRCPPVSSLLHDGMDIDHVDSDTTWTTAQERLCRAWCPLCIVETIEDAMACALDRAISVDRHIRLTYLEHGG